MTDATDPAISKSTDSDNPFAVSSLFQKTLSEDLLVAPPPSWFRVEGNLLVCGPQVVLPAICIHWLLDEDLKPVRVRVGYSFMKLVVEARFCEITFFESRRIRKGRLLLRWMGSIMFIAGTILFLLPVSAVVGMPVGLAKMASIPCFLVSVFGLRFDRTPFTLSRYEPHGVYYVKGFPKHFLKHIASNQSASTD
jgi:hypothetical protein